MGTEAHCHARPGSLMRRFPSVVWRLEPQGPMAEWLRRGLQILARRFDSGSGLHIPAHRHCDQPQCEPGGAICAALAQLVEHIIRNDGVRCSSHLSGTTTSSRKKRGFQRKGRSAGPVTGRPLAEGRLRRRRRYLDGRGGPFACPERPCLQGGTAGCRASRMRAAILPRLLPGCRCAGLRRSPSRPCRGGVAACPPGFRCCRLPSAARRANGPWRSCWPRSGR